MIGDRVRTREARNPLLSWLRTIGTLLIAFVVFAAICYGFCMVMFLLNQASLQGSTY